MGPRRPLFAVSLLALTVLLGVAPAFAANRLEIVTLSNRPDKLSGGDVLVLVTVPPGTKLNDVAVALNGDDVTAAFWQDVGHHALVGLVKGMHLGKNRLEAKAKHAGTDTLQLVNHSLTGPILSGPQEEPFFCQTHQFRVYPGGPLLTELQITDPCSVPTRVDYVYRSTGGAFKGLPPSPLPADLATTTTIDGHSVPYIVRLETGTLNRAIYQTAILDDPAVPGPDLRNHDPAWNGRLVYTFGGGCGGGHYIQGNTTGGVLNDMMLSRGFAVASSTLNVLGQNCNFVTSAETVMMVKEHFIETYGVPRYTMGWFCSGGSIQQHLIGDNYPGLMDGIVPQCSFPDVAGATTFDARLLYNYYLNTKGVPWTQEEIRAVSGFGTYGHIVNQGTLWAARIDPVPNRAGFPPQSSWLYNDIVPLSARYDPASNPTGARATTYDHNVNIFGRDEKGFSRRPLDNVGIQYGLAALNAGQISTGQFLDLNEKIGGLDIDANFTAQRMIADEAATKAAYQTGFVMNGGGGLASVPILDFDLIYSDLLPTGDVHMKFHHFTTRERLRKANGHADNHVMWSGGTSVRAGFVSTQAFLQMDKWLTAITEDISDTSLAKKVVKHKPIDLVDGCWTGGATTFTPEPQFFGGPGTSFCNNNYPGFPFPRYIAGAPLTIDTVKCRLQRIDLADYKVSLAPAEITRLRQIFRDGVCDWSRPGIEQQEPVSTWITYTGIGKYRGDSTGDEAERDNNDEDGRRD